MKQGINAELKCKNELSNEKKTEKFINRAKIDFPSIDFLDQFSMESYFSKINSKLSKSTLNFQKIGVTIFE